MNDRRLPLFERIFGHRLGGVAILAALLLSIAFATRLVLLATNWSAIAARWDVLAAAFAVGALQDAALAAWVAVPALVYLALLPQRVFAHRLHAALATAFFLVTIFGLIFTGFAEWFFWDEFGTRFNFIAVDYLIYTREVLGNIWESYPIPRLLVAIAVVAFGMLVALRRTAPYAQWIRSATPLRRRLGAAGVAIVACVAFGVGIGERALPTFANRYDAELARNGVLAFVGAFRSARLDYADFYRTIDPTLAFRLLRERLDPDPRAFLSTDPHDLRRRVENVGEALHYNVIQITVESLSGHYLGVLGGTDGLTPRLDALARDGLLFTNFYATGTRTVRGMEALSLSVPPTPGESIVKRPHNGDLFTLGSVFRERGYDTVFLYGGYGYFDNMNAFFSGNGYRVVDRSSVPADAIHFANVWGAADEDLFSWVLDEADRAHARQQPFHHFVMTTSNHRPFTYPDGRIDIPSLSSRQGAVKYTDWAIGHFLDEARKHAWFDQTLFVIVADHCASTTGRTDVPARYYRIPLIIYAPGLVERGRVDTLASQIDLAPTILGMLHWDYESRFFGQDILAMRPQDERAFVSTYETLGYLKGADLVVLKPQRQEFAFRYDRETGEQMPVANVDPELSREAIVYYQSADALYGLRVGDPPPPASDSRRR